MVSPRVLPQFSWWRLWQPVWNLHVMLSELMDFPWKITGNSVILSVHSPACCSLCSFVFTVYLFFWLLYISRLVGYHRGLNTFCRYMGCIMHIWKTQSLGFRLLSCLMSVSDMMLKWDVFVSILNSPAGLTVTSSVMCLCVLLSPSTCVVHLLWLPTQVQL